MMNDLPAITLLQQQHAVPHSGEELEILGKYAADRFVQGQHPTLNDAVVSAVKSAGLSPEQVRRVIEFANTRAYLTAFNKEGSEHRYIVFDGGPASPAEVLRELNSGGGGTVFDRGSADYILPPKIASAVPAAEMDKTASAQYADNGLLDFDPEETALKLAFATSGEEYPAAEPFNDLEYLQDKLAGAIEQTNAATFGLENLFSECTEELYQQVKQAAMEGVTLGQVLTAWSEVVPAADYVKLAFADIGPRLLQEEVFKSAQGLADSLQKVASRAVTNMEHPLVGSFAMYCEVFGKLAEMRTASENLAKEQAWVNQQAQDLYKTALQAPVAAAAGATPLRNAARDIRDEGGAVQKVVDFADRMGTHGERITKGIGEYALGRGHGAAEGAGKLVGGAIRYAPHLALAGAGISAADRLHNKWKAYQVARRQELMMGGAY